MTANRVEHSYGSHQVIAGVDLCVHPGEVLAVEGRSGSGKSTLLHILAGLISPNRGTVRLLGEPFSDRSEAERARDRLRSVGFVFQNGGLVPEFSAVENVELPLLLLGQSKTVARQAALTLLEELNVSDQADKRLAEMSGGQYQRVAVARALVHDPVLVFGDEPTGSLDQDSSDRVLEAMFRSARKRGSAVIIVSHDKQVTCQTDRILHLAGGRLE